MVKKEETAAEAKPNKEVTPTENGGKETSDEKKKPQLPDNMEEVEEKPEPAQEKVPQESETKKEEPPIEEPKPVAEIEVK